MTIDNSADNTDLLIEKAKAEVFESDLFPIAAQSLVEVVKTIPGIGQVLAAGEQLQVKRRIEYLEKCVDELHDAANQRWSGLTSSNRTIDDERLTRLIYDGLTRAITAQSDSQRHRTMRAVRNAMLSAGGSEADYDEEMWMLKTADEMIQPDVDVLVGAFRASERGEEYLIVPEEEDMKMAAIERLRSFGLLVARDQTAVVVDGGVGRMAEISSLGKRFVAFALDDQL